MEKKNNFFSNLGAYIKDTILTKTYGCFVGLGAVLLTFVQMIIYCSVPAETYNPAVIAYCVVGIVLFLVLSLFRCTSRIAPVALMMFDFACIVGLAQADGIVDYLSTQFFSGINLSVLPGAFTASVIFFILSFITSSVAIYLPQNKKEKLPEEETVAAEVEA